MAEHSTRSSTRIPAPQRRQYPAITRFTILLEHVTGQNTSGASKLGVSIKTAVALTFSHAQFKCLTQMYGKTYVLVEIRLLVGSA